MCASSLPLLEDACSADGVLLHQHAQVENIPSTRPHLDLEAVAVLREQAGRQAGVAAEQSVRRRCRGAGCSTRGGAAIQPAGLSKPRTALAIPQGNAHRALDLVLKEHVDGILSLQREKHKWHWGVSGPVGWAEGAPKQARRRQRRQAGGCPTASCQGGQRRGSPCGRP